jgi:protein-disulfide isomerase
MSLRIMSLRFLAAAVVVLSLLTATPGQSQSLRDEIEGVVKDYILKHPQDIQQIIKDYLVKNPEVLQQVLAEALRNRGPAAANPATANNAPAAADKSALVKSNAAALFNSKRQVTLGNPQGDVTLVEFFDYSCGFCKRALSDTVELLKNDPKLKVVLKEFPILGPGSLEAARIAVAVRMQDPQGARYFEFHKKLLGDPMPPNRALALAVARAAGLDMARLEKDEVSSEVNETIEESANLARTLGMNGTPSYVIGDQVVVGAVGIASLKDRIQAARK